ncbi:MULTISPECIES: metal-dependent hydrolase [Clostridium]|uniref:Membrane-associated metal-binding protein n=1 Tax=Clostridium disporicum TaxID=84024 RepID=A0A174GTR4_9CLOT|nr:MULTISPECIES: metal-dependent hydrolase [Clostridium]CUO65903.1 membrane-associated metal-binding protein [Clostridium disporicum]
MSGKEHMIVGTTATATMGVGFLITKTFDSVIYLIPLIIGGFIGSYMPDIDSYNSKVRQVFNKILTFLIIAIFIGYMLGIMLNVNDIILFLQSNFSNYFGAIMFCIVTILGKLSPHRMFTHKWLGTLLFCGCVYFIGNIYLTLGFTMGYILHIVCDRFSPRGKNLKFFEFKLPCRNSKNKTTIMW